MLCKFNVPGITCGKNLNTGKRLYIYGIAAGLFFVYSLPGLLFGLVQPAAIFFSLIINSLIAACSTLFVFFNLFCHSFLRSASAITVLAQATAS